MKKIISLTIALLVAGVLGATVFYNEVTNYVMDYNLRLNEIQNQYDTSLIDFETDKNKAVNHLKEYTTKGKSSVKCSINDVKATVKEDALQIFKINYRTIVNYKIDKYIAFITIKDGEVTSIENFKDLN